jgi:dihydrofolate reductase
MTRLTYFTATTLDGFIADEHDSLEWLFKQKGRGQDEPLAYDTFIADIGAIVMGRTTYDWVRDHLARSDEAWPYAMPAWVMTHRPAEPIPDADVRFADGDARTVHDAMAEAAAGKDLWVVGGGDLVGQFADAGLLDEVIVQIAPVTLGAGRPLLPRPLDLRTEQVERNADFVAARYSVVGPLEV